MQTSIKTLSTSLDFKFLPSFARFILDNYLDEYVKEQIILSREIELPLLKYFKSLSDEELVNLSKKTNIETLRLISQNKIREQVQITNNNWVNNQIPRLSRDEIVAEDITRASYLRRQCFIKFISAYTNDPKEIIELVTEINRFALETDSLSTNTYIDLLQISINEHLHFIQKITEALPGIVYVFDIIEETEIYVNKSIQEFLGYPVENVKKKEKKIDSNLIHLDDIEEIRRYEESFLSVPDGEIRSIQYRMKDPKGAYRWIRAYEAPFKRKTDGRLWQKIGIVIDIHNEKIFAEKLQQREEQLLKAQEIANIGSFEWDLVNDEAINSPQVNLIFEFNTGKKFPDFMTQVHPSDQAKVKTALKEAIEVSGIYDCEFRFITNDKEKVIWSHAVVQYENGKAIGLKGTIMDVTNRHHMIRRLQRSEELYKQAQAITHIGNYIWDLKTYKITWSEELYRIYGLDPHVDEITYEKIFPYNHPDDIEIVRQKTQAAIKNHTPFDFTYRIIMRDKTQKILHARGEVLYDENTGEAYNVIGTTQDVTQREKLIKRLQQSEAIYKQAESLAKIGNWKWDLQNETLEWTDELYRIYGLEPQSETITLNRFKSFIHPQDREYVEKGIKDALEQHSQDFTFRILIDNKIVRTIRSIAQVQFNENGQAAYVIGTEQDVTEREEMLSRLRESENLYKQSQSIAHVGNWAWDVKENKITWSDELYRIFGVDKDRPIDYSTYISLIHPDDVHLITTNVEGALNLREPYEFHHRVKWNDGTVRILHSRGEPMIDANGQVYKLIGTAQDVTEKEELIDRLQESDTLYKQAQELSHIGNFIYDVAVDKIFWSDELFRIYGLEPQSEEMNWNRFIELIHPDDRNLVSIFSEQAISSKQPFEMYHRNLWKDGTIKTLHIKGEVLTDETGNVSRLFGTAQDVTKQQVIEQQLIENQNFIMKIADATPSIIASYNINTGQYRFISQGLEKLLGYEADLPLKEGVAFFSAIIHPDDAPSIMQKNVKALELANSETELNPDIVVEFQYRMRHKNGHYRWFHTYGTIFDRNAEGKVEHVLNISLDITEAKEAEQKIKEQEHFIENIAEASPTILYLYDVKKDKINYINQEIKNVIGFTPEEIIEMGSAFRSDIYHPDDITKLPEKNDGYTDLAKDVNSMFEYECRMKAKEGPWRWLLVREIIFTRDDNGNPLQVLGAAIDISERKEIEQTLYQKNIQLEQSNTSLEEFAYVASHDLQEPLRKISVFGDRLMAVEKQLSKDNRIYLKKIIDSSLRMQALIDDLLMISRISHDKSFQQYSLQTILKEVLQMLEHKIEKQKAFIKSDPLPVAEIIPSQFRQLFQNLISNSLKFIKPDVQPQINITCKYLSQSEVSKYSIAKSRRYLQITFTDNGIGFENEYALRIFAIFQRLHGKAEYEGTGIGLAICKKIVENHGGVILASGEPGKGSTFTVIIPV